jgi:hypothetical protein
MFQNKKKELFSVKEKSTVADTLSTTENPFIMGALKKSAEGLSGNGSFKYTTTGDDFVDQFGSLGNFLEIRSYQDISKDMAMLYSQNPEMAVRFTLYMRTITRKSKTLSGDKTEDVQKGAGLKHDSIVRMMWLNLNHRDVFWKNIELFITLGSWKDIFDMLRMDLEYNGWEGRVLDWDNFSTLIISGLENPNSTQLVKKYLPSIKAKSNATTLRSQANTLIGKFISNRLFGAKQGYNNGYKQYRKLKSSGEAHKWQQQISEKLFSEIDFNTIHGRALSKLVSSKFLANHGLEDKYNEWIEAQPVAKFTGYVHELAMAIGAPNMNGRYRGNYGSINIKPHVKATINKQFEGLRQLGKENVNVDSNMIVVRDTSSSMTDNVPNQKISSFDVAKALGIYFGTLLEGPFSNAWIEFHDKTTLHTYKADNFVDMWLSDSSEAYGSTNIIGVAKLFVDLLASGIPENQFPTGIIAISDGEFNRTGTNKVTTFNLFREALSSGGFSDEFVKNFKIVMWDIPNRFYGHQPDTKFESFGETENVFYMSGYDGTNIGFLLGGTDSKGNEKAAPKTDKELFLAAMDQTILNMVTI